MRILICLLLLLPFLVFSQENNEYRLKATKISNKSKSKIYSIKKDSRLRIRSNSGELIKYTKDYKIIEDAIVFGINDTIKLNEIKSITGNFESKKANLRIGILLFVYVPVAIFGGLFIFVSSYGSTNDVQMNMGISILASVIPAMAAGLHSINNHKTFYTEHYKLEIYSLE